MVLEDIRNRFVAQYLTPRLSRTFWDRWTHPESLHGRMLALEDQLAVAQMKLYEAMSGPIEEVASLLREWWNSQPGMPYTAPSAWDASQMAGDR